MIDGIGTSGYSASMMSGMRQRMAPDPDKISEKLLAKVDADSDGNISKSEFTSLFETSESSDSESIDGLFSQMDSDGDGSVTTEEASIAISDLLIQQMQQQGMGNNMPPPPPPANGEGKSAEELISSADTDEDGSLNLSEFTEALKHPGDNEDSSQINSLFSDADADGDGKVTQDELQAAMDNHHSKHQQGDAGEDETTSSSEQISNLVQAMLQQYQTNNNGEISSILELQA